MTGLLSFHSRTILSHILSSLILECAARRHAFINNSNSWKNEESIKRTAAESSEDVIQIKMQR